VDAGRRRPGAGDVGQPRLRRPELHALAASQDRAAAGDDPTPPAATSRWRSTAASPRRPRACAPRPARAPWWPAPPSSAAGQTAMPTTSAPPGGRLSLGAGHGRSLAPKRVRAAPARSCGWACCRSRSATDGAGMGRLAAAPDIAGRARGPPALSRAARVCAPLFQRRRSPYWFGRFVLAGRRWTSGFPRAIPGPAQSLARLRRRPASHGLAGRPAGRRRAVTRLRLPTRWPGTGVRPWNDFSWTVRSWRRGGGEQSFKVAVRAKRRNEVGARCSAGSVGAPGGRRGPDGRPLLANSLARRRAAAAAGREPSRAAERCLAIAATAGARSAARRRERLLTHGPAQLSPALNGAVPGRRGAHASRLGPGRDGALFDLLQAWTTPGPARPAGRPSACPAHRPTDPRPWSRLHPARRAAGRLLQGGEAARPRMVSAAGAGRTRAPWPSLAARGRRTAATSG